MSQNIDIPPLELTRSLVDYAKKRGADEVEISLSRGSELSVDVRDGIVENLVQAGSHRLYMRIFIEQRTATASSSDLTPSTLHEQADRALERARLTEADPFAGLPELVPLSLSVESLDIYDERVPDLTPESLTKRAAELESICMKERLITRSYGAHVSVESGEFYLSNSNGFSESYQSTSCTSGITLQSETGDYPVEEGWYETVHHLDDQMDIQSLAETAVHRVTRMLRPRKIHTCRVPVILEAPVTSHLLGFLYQCVHGRSIYMKQSCLAGRLDNKIASDPVNIWDRACIPRGPGSVPFDTEGIPPGELPVIRKGVLENYLLDTYSGRKLGRSSTGHASGPTNFFMENGTLSPEAIVRSVDKGLLITDFIGQGFMPVSGDFSKGVFGIWIENGEPVYPVAEVTVSGNLLTLLRNIEMVGNDLKLRKRINGPTVRISELTVGGK
jgi:PmbA protein